MDSIGYIQVWSDAQDLNEGTLSRFACSVTGESAVGGARCPGVSGCSGGLDGCMVKSVSP